MTAKKKSQDVIIVTGDVTMDWHIAREPDHGDRWSIDRCSRVWWQRGGAALQADLIAAMIESLKQRHQIDFGLRQPGTPNAPVHHGDPRFHHFYALWSQVKEGNKKVWRVEQFLGMDICTPDPTKGEDDWQRVEDDFPQANMVVIDDSNLGFRDREDLWPQALQDPTQRPWVLFKMFKPVAQGPLWEHLLEHYADRLIVVTTIDDLRKTEVQISRQLSWERTAQDVVWELTHNPCVNGFSRCAHVIISLHAAGAIWLSRSTQGSPHAQLVFDPQVMEGDWEQKHPGHMVGYTSCLTTALARQVMLDPAAPDLQQGLQNGLSGIRALHLEGYGAPDSDPQEAELRFPIHKIVSEFSAENTPMAVAGIQDPIQNLLSPMDPETPRVMPGFWTILEDRYTGALNDVAQRIVLEGLDTALEGVPLGRFGALCTVDRREIEALHSIGSLITEYCQRPQKRPLSIAVFGPPGSGKSFGVTQIAKSVRPGEIAVLNFNISQFGHPDELLDALHQVRDIGLSGKIPIVFWDEFDTALNGRRLGWLRYFLAPMQDGAFQEGQIIHPIGRAIFVFAGGTSHRMEEFGADLDEVEGRAAKLPDFISRLKGFLNVLGPNRIDEADSHAVGPRIADPYYIIRRAIILRVLFELNIPQILHQEGRIKRVHIDRGILRAFLETRRYKHGVRSMESIITMSMLAGKTAFERSNLPSEDQLNLHVDGVDFLARVQQMSLKGELLENLAKATHEVFCEGLKEQGYTYGPETDSEQKTHNSLKPYKELREDEKEANRSNVRDIANKLATAGYVMVPARSNEPPFDFPGDDLELLARMEHERWVADKVNAGWSYAAKTEKDKKLHSALVDWDELSDGEKEKDREMVRGIPRILAKAGFAIVKC
jgi:hypothetical protein